MRPYARLLNRTAFLSASLHYEDRPVVDFFRGLLFEYGIRPVTIGIDVYAVNNYEAAMIAEQERESRLRRRDTDEALPLGRCPLQTVGMDL